eukprot:TRINITY_DN4738_c0_g1_i1.p1 TRINITY_DN4738_c0_g1~~TRINITY_DN4738_c0_g1_i1.p1  ORF type:complete len:239 (+),score=67.40 TRINITY_DN4738_c0_g1_i1:28-717(+)
MADADFWFDQLNEGLNDMTRLMKQYRSLDLSSGGAKMLYKDIKNRWEDVGVTFSTLQVFVDDHSSNVKIIKEFHEIQEFYQQIETEYNNLSGPTKSTAINIGDLTAGQVTSLTHEIAKKDTDAAHRIARLANDVIDESITNLDKLKANTARLENAMDRMDEVEDETSIARTQIRNFFQTIVSDKFTVVLLFILLVAIIGLVVFKITHPSSEIITPPAPPGGYVITINNR